MLPTWLPTWPATWPVSLMWPLSGVTIVISFGLPLTVMVPREIVMPMSALDKRPLIGLSLLPASSRGVVASRFCAMADSEMATGAITCEARASCGRSGSFGSLSTARLASLAGGKK